jgi:hypothetical protein
MAPWFQKCYTFFTLLLQKIVTNRLTIQIKIYCGKIDPVWTQFVLLVFNLKTKRPTVLLYYYYYYYYYYYNILSQVFFLPWYFSP